MRSIYLAVFCCEFAAALLLIRLIIPIAIRIGYVDKPSPRKLHREPTPYGGGVAIFLTLLAAMLVYAAAWAAGLFNPKSQPVNWGLLSRDPRVLAIAAGGAGIFLLGLVDDLRDLRPRTKLFFQILIVLLTSPWAPSMSFLSAWPILSILATVGWVVLITNAFNLLDNMDGLCASVALVNLALHLLLLHSGGQHLVAMITVILAAPVLAFLLYNAPPARIFLGDAGSLLLGYAIAHLSILSTYYREGSNLAAFFIPLFILAIPLYDVASVIYIRRRQGRPVFQADRSHFSHRLLALGLSPWQVLLTLVSLSLAMGLGALLLTRVGNRESIMISGQALLIFLVVVILEYAGAKANKPG